jgi:hypothetical protein
MNRARNILRFIFLVAAIFLIVRINQKTDEHVKSIVQFKFEVLKKMSQDSLASKEKVALMVDETTKFVRDSSQVKEGVDYFIKLAGLVIVAEIIFLILLKKF